MTKKETPTAPEVELLKLEFQRRTFWWDWLARIVSPLLAAVAVTVIGGRFLADLKPIHLETGSVSFDVSATDKSCICRNVVRKAFLEREGPLDANGRPCLLSARAVERNDRADAGGPYYLTSDFEPHASVQDRRCYRQALVTVKQTFSQVPRVSLQIAWIDARTYDETDDGRPVLVGGRDGQPLLPRGLNVRFDVRPERVTKDGFDVVLKTWSDSRIYAAEVAYTAFVQ